MCDKYDFFSAFTPMLSGFICERQCLGYKYESEARCLQHFDRYCNDHCFPPVLSEEVVKGYVRPDPNRCIKTTLNRIGLLRQFALYLHRNGHDAWLYPEELFPKKEAVFHPYVFTNDEISRFLEAAKHIPYNKQHPYRHLVLPLLFRTLYCCGLRISEALNLKIRDVDLNEGVLPAGIHWSCLPEVAMGMWYFLWWSPRPIEASDVGSHVKSIPEWLSTNKWFSSSKLAHFALDVHLKILR